MACSIKVHMLKNHKITVWLDVSIFVNEISCVHYVWEMQVNFRTLYRAQKQKLCNSV